MCLVTLKAATAFSMFDSRFKTPEQIANTATARYLVALSLIGLLALSAFLVMSAKLKHQDDHAYILNLSGRQRMLSQRSFLCASGVLLYSSSVQGQASVTLAGKLPTADKHCLEDIRQFKDNHAYLSQYIKNQKFVPDIQRKLKTLYFDSGGLSEQITLYTDQLQQAVETRQAQFLPANIQRLQLLESLEQSVNFLERDTEQDIQNLRILEFWIFIAILLGLLLEAMFIFRPLVASLRHDQERLVKAQRDAEQSSRVKTEFLANMSHEIRTPINGMTGMIQLLGMTTLTNEQKEYVHTLSQSTQSLLSLVNEILDYSKLEANKMRLENTAFSLYKVVDELIELTSQDAQQRGFDFMVCVEPDVPDYIMGDPVRLRQVIMNLISNAFKFTEAGYVQLSIRVVSSPDGSVVLRFSVEDTGKGIAPEKLDRVFQKFEQEDNSTTRCYGGTGLGLTISKYLVEQMGGGIYVKSDTNVGSTFWFDVPYRLVADSVQQDDVSIGEHAQLFKVLVVDEHPGYCQYVAQLLSSWGHQVQTCHRVTEAWACLGQSQKEYQPFDVVLCSHPLDQQSGEMFARAVKSDPAMYDIIVVLITQRYHPNMYDEIRQAGLSGLLVKPLSPLLLKQLFIMLSLQAKRHIDPAGTFYTRLSLSKMSEHYTASIPGNTQDNVELLLLTGSSVSQAATGHILVVDDTPVNLKVLQHMLTKLGFSVDVAFSGREALQQVKNKAYQLVFMDFHMPEMNGLEACELIRLQYSAEVLPIIALTADTDKEVKQRCKAAGMNSFIEKPVHFESLIAELKKVDLLPPQAQSTMAP